MLLRDSHARQGFLLLRSLSSTVWRSVFALESCLIEEKRRQLHEAVMCVVLFLEQHQIDFFDSFLILADLVHDDAVIFPSKDIYRKTWTLLLKLFYLFQGCGE